MKENESIENKQQAYKFKDWIYKHFTEASTKETKITLYVNTYIPINQRLNDFVNPMNNVRNHCVVVKRITVWEHQINHKRESHQVECYEIEDFRGSEQTSYRYIPVNHPCFEEIEDDLNKAFNQYQGSEKNWALKRKLNKIGSSLAKTKFGPLESNWYEQKMKSNMNIDDKYPMLFFRCLHPCFQLKFKVSS